MVMKSSIAVDLQVQMFPRLASRMALLRTFALIVASLIAVNSVTASAFSQSLLADNGWSALRDLPRMTRIHVTSARIGTTCSFLFANDEKLVCSSGRTPATAHIMFSRFEVKSVRLTFLAESELTGYAIRFSLSAHLNPVMKSRNDDSVDHLSDVIVGLAVLADRLMSGAVGASIGAVRGSTVYQQPKPQV
jgi:hypothetical protein